MKVNFLKTEVILLNDVTQVHKNLSVASSVSKSYDNSQFHKIKRNVRNHCLTVCYRPIINAEMQWRINHDANDAMAWGPPLKTAARGAPFHGRLSSFFR